MTIGDKIRIRREELGFSQVDLAKLIGVTQGSIGNYENGVSNPKMELIPALLKALDVDANYLFGTIKPEEEKSAPNRVCLGSLRAPVSLDCSFFCASRYALIIDSMFVTRCSSALTSTGGTS